MNLQAQIVISLLALLFNTTLLQSVKAQEQTKQIYVKVEVDGLSCPFCAYGLEKKLKEIEGASNIEIDVKNGFVTLEFPEEKKPAEDKLRKAVKNAGFTSREISFSSNAFDNVGK